jgi:AraC-like DNA-binding protein
LIEGKAYKLKPWDILLVSNNEVHKPIIDSGEIYERIVIWANPVFLKEHSDNDCNLEQCFEYTSSSKYNLLRLDPEQLKRIRHIILQLEEALKSNDFGSRILKNALFMQFIVHLNRQILVMSSNTIYADINYDESIEQILNYINENLSDNLSIDALSNKFYISKYHLMRKFKAQTGYTIYSYILQKRLIMASTLIKSGKPSTETSIECGFGDYSSFIRAFKKMFGLSPRQYKIDRGQSCT